MTRTRILLIVLIIAALFLIRDAEHGSLLISLVRYFTFTMHEGDWLNDWLTHLWPIMQPACAFLGRIIAAVQY